MEKNKHIDRCAKLILAALFAIAGTSVFGAPSERYFQERFCAGMEQNKGTSLGTEYDCLTDEYAIEVDFTHKWFEAIGQSLHYAEVLNRKPGIILVCVQGQLCFAHSYRLTRVIEKYRLPITVWWCEASDSSLDECNKLVWE